MRSSYGVAIPELSLKKLASGNEAASVLNGGGVVTRQRKVL